MRPEEWDVAYLWDMLEAAKQVVQMTKSVSFGVKPVSLT
jgi:hypothetical protein